jgi:predicted kinase
MPHELHIVTGAAGVGKSTFGRSLAGKSQAAFLDSDTLSGSIRPIATAASTKRFSGMPFTNVFSKLPRKTSLTRPS